MSWRATVQMRSDALTFRTETIDHTGSTALEEHAMAA